MASKDRKGSHNKSGCSRASWEVLMQSVFKGRDKKENLAQDEMGKVQRSEWKDREPWTVARALSSRETKGRLRTVLRSTDKGRR